jgi:hypothetical protein
MSYTPPAGNAVTLQFTLAYVVPAGNAVNLVLTDDPVNVGTGIRHRFSNPKADGGDATITRPSNWNEEHVVQGDQQSTILPLTVASPTSTDRPDIEYRRARGSLASPLAVQSGDYLGFLRWRAFNTSLFGYAYAADIYARADAAPSGNFVPGRISFSTSDGTANPQERVRIDSAGRVAIGTLAPQALLNLGAGGEIQFYNPAESSQWRIGYTSNDGSLRWRFNNSSTLMSLTNNAFVGIGSATPTCALQVAGVAQFTGNTFPTTGAGIELSYNGGYGGVASYDRGGGVYLSQAYNALDHTWMASGVIKMLLYSSGALGINTLSTGIAGTNPLLQVNNNSTGGQLKLCASFLNTDASDGIGTQIEFGQPTGTNVRFGGRYHGTAWSGWGAFIDAPNAIAFQFSQVDKALMDSNGSFRCNGIVRAEGTNPVYGGAGYGMEVGSIAGNQCYVQAYDRTGSAYTPMVFYGLNYAFSGSGGLAVNGAAGSAAYTFDAFGRARAYAHVCDKVPDANAWAGLDQSAATVTIANGGHYDVTTFSGMLVLTDGSQTGHTGCYLVGGAIVTFLGGGSLWQAPTLTPSAGNASVAWNGGTSAYRISNNQGNSLTIGIASVKTRVTV